MTYRILARKYADSGYQDPKTFATFEEIPAHMQAHVAMVLAADDRSIEGVGDALVIGGVNKVYLYDVTWEVP